MCCTCCGGNPVCCGCALCPLCPLLCPLRGRARQGEGPGMAGSQLDMPRASRSAPILPPRTLTHGSSECRPGVLSTGRSLSLAPAGERKRMEACPQSSASGQCVWRWPTDRKSFGRISQGESWWFRRCWAWTANPRRAQEKAAAGRHCQGVQEEGRDLGGTHYRQRLDARKEGLGEGQELELNKGRIWKGREWDKEGTVTIFKEFSSSIFYLNILKF